MWELFSETQCSESIYASQHTTSIIRQ